MLDKINEEKSDWASHEDTKDKTKASGEVDGAR